MLPTRRILFVLLVLLNGCAQFPALDGRVTAAERAAPFPALVPLGPILAAAASSTGHGAGLPTGRIAGLNARAEALRGAVISAETRARLRGGIDTTALQ